MVVTMHREGDYEDIPFLAGAYVRCGVGGAGRVTIRRSRSAWWLGFRPAAVPIVRAHPRAETRRATRPAGGDREPPGATGTTAAAKVATSPADGYTLMMGHVSVNAIAPSLFSNLGYDVIRDFAPVAIAASVPHLVTVHPSLPVNSLKEMIAP